jgi:hypothetical protein
MLILAVACQCTGRRTDEHTANSEDLAAASTDTGESTTSAGEPTTETTGDVVDVSRFMGVFHSEFDFIPFGREVPNTGDPVIANLEIRPDGTASMVMENCDLNYGPLEIAWRWDARPGPTLEFTPGPGEGSLRFMARSDLQSVRATLDGCDLLFEVDGAPVSTEVYRPGRACWVNRCMPAWTVHIDYCDGQAPPPCE